MDETEDEKTLVTDNLVTNEPRYFNLFECGKNSLNNHDAKFELSCMATSNDKYKREMGDTLTNYNYLNNNPLSKANIL